MKKKQICQHSLFWFKGICCIMLFLVHSEIGNAQMNQIKGTIIDPENVPLTGATILVEGTQVGTVADMDGNFIISAKKGQSLLVSYIGFKTKKVLVTTSSFYSITLESDNLLDEVIVVGYGTQKKVNLTGAVASVSTEQFANRPIVAASTLLQGAATGVTVTTGGGAPGADVGTIRIRGIGTFGGSNASPLVLIDGVEGTLDAVDASQIDKISVLKDAASSAIYGSRAANGVVLITTKRGSKGHSSVSYRTYVGWQSPTTLPDLVSPEEYMILNREATENDEQTSIYTDDYIKYYRMNNYLDPDAYPITDWRDKLLTGSGFMHNHNVVLSASSDKIKVMTSFGYLDQQAIIKHTGYTRYNVRNNMDVELNKKLNFRFDISASYGLRDQLPLQNNIFNVMNSKDPLILSQWSSGDYAALTGGSVNVIPMIEQGVGGNVKKKTLNLNGSAALTWKPWEWLKLEGVISPRFVMKKNHTFQDKVKYYSDAEGTVSTASNVAYNSLTEDEEKTFYGNYQFTAAFQKSLNTDHKLGILLGASRETFDMETLSAYRRDFAYPQYEVIGAGADNETKSNDGGRYQWILQSYFGRINYNYKERYLFEANVRFDGSSRFAKGNRWGVFPSFSGAWRVTEEPFIMDKVKNVLSELKIRASYGQLGNQNIGSSYYPTVQNLTVSSISANNIIYPIVALNSLANPDITWETSEMYDIGVDATLWNKFTITADWYYKTTRDILMRLDIPSTIGLNAPYQNAGVVRNIGWEIGLGYSTTWRDFSFGVEANLSDVYNKITDMKGTKGGSGFIRNQEGSAINSIFGLKCLGIARTQDDADYVNAKTPQYGQITHPGDLVYEDYNGDGKVDDDDKQIIGSTIPRYTYGITLNFGWKGLNLSAQIQGVGKADSYISGEYTQPCVQGGTFRKEHLNRWTPENPGGKFPRLSMSNELNRKASSFWMTNAAYCRLKNIQLSYTLSQKIVEKIGLKSLMFFANGTNLLTLTDFYQGYDPEIAYDQNATDGVSLGAVGNRYPLVKTVTVGFEVKF